MISRIREITETRLIGPAPTGYLRATRRLTTPPRPFALVVAPIDQPSRQRLDALAQRQRHARARRPRGSLFFSPKAPRQCQCPIFTQLGGVSAFHASAGRI